MKTVSKAYTKSMKSPLRGRSFVNIKLRNINYAALRGSKWDCGDCLWSSGLTALSDADYEYGSTYATLELNRWVLGSDDIIAPNTNQQDGYISSSLALENGYRQKIYPLYTAIRPSQSFTAATIVFDTRTHEHPSRVQVVFRDETGTDTSVMVDVLGDEVIVGNPCGKVTDLIVYPMGYVLPYHRYRFEKILFGFEKVYQNEDIVSTKTSHDVDPLSRRLPKKSLEFTLIDYKHDYDPENPQGVYKYLDGSPTADIQFGYELPDKSVEWLKRTRYCLDPKPEAKNNMASFKATDLIDAMNNIYYKDSFDTRSCFAKAMGVLQDANLELTPNGSSPWKVDSSLYADACYSVLPKDTGKNCLQMIAHAACSTFDTDDDNIICIEPFDINRSGLTRGTFLIAGGEAYFSETGTVDNGSPVDNTYVTLELNRWTLGGVDQVIIPDNHPAGRGYVSEILSDVNGSYVSMNQPTLYRTFNEPHDVTTLAIKFDAPVDEYPTSVNVTYYKGTITLDSQTFPITDCTMYLHSTKAKACTQYGITFMSGLPYRRARIGRLFYRDSDYVLDFTSIKENSQIATRIDPLKVVEVTQYSYTQDSYYDATDKAAWIARATTYYSEENPVPRAFHYEFPEIVGGAAVWTQNAPSMVVTLYPNAMDTEITVGTTGFQIKGVPTVVKNEVYSYPVGSIGEVDKEDNPLITNKERRDALAAQVSDYLTMSTTYDVTYRGNPELEVGDVIGLQTPYSNDVDALILSHEITFNGSLSGKMKVKALV